MMAPLTVINYLIVHELAHLKFTKLDAPFRNKVDKVLPDYVKQKEWLKRYGYVVGVVKGAEAEGNSYQVNTLTINRLEGASG
jgi:hypothetical protein